MNLDFRTALSTLSVLGTTFCATLVPLESQAEINYKAVTHYNRKFYESSRATKREGVNRKVQDVLKNEEFPNLSPELTLIFYQMMQIPADRALKANAWINASDICEFAWRWLADDANRIENAKLRLDAAEMALLLMSRYAGQPRAEWMHSQVDNIRALANAHGFVAVSSGTSFVVRKL